MPTRHAPAAWCPWPQNFVQRLLSQQAALAIAGYLMSEEILKAIITGVVGPVIVASINQRRDSRTATGSFPTKSSVVADANAANVVSTRTLWKRFLMSFALFWLVAFVVVAINMTVNPNYDPNLPPNPTSQFFMVMPLILNGYYFWRIVFRLLTSW